MTTSENAERNRLVVLGPGQVGKTCIIRRFLSNHFSERYKETVEDIYSRDFKVHGSLLPLDIYDTNFNYPDMRRISIASANAFLLVFSVNNVVSFKDVTDILQEICQRRSDAASIPIVIAGNKSDLPQQKIFRETVDAWMTQLPRLQDNLAYIESSAKNGENVQLLFETLLRISGYPYSLLDNNTTPTMPRRGNRLNKSRPSSTRDRATQRPAAKSPPPPAADSPTAMDSLSAAVTALRFGDEEHRPLTRHASLMRKPQRLSLRFKKVAADEPDDSECKIQ